MEGGGCVCDYSWWATKNCSVNILPFKGGERGRPKMLRLNWREADKVQGKPGFNRFTFLRPDLFSFKLFLVKRIHMTYEVFTKSQRAKFTYLFSSKIKVNFPYSFSKHYSSSNNLLGQVCAQCTCLGKFDNNMWHQIWPGNILDRAKKAKAFLKNNK